MLGEPICLFLGCLRKEVKSIKIYIIALITFLVIDLVWLSFIAKNMYQEQLGHLMADNFNLIAAFVFYALFVFGLVYFVINPGIEKESIRYILIAGALFGFMTYATYDLTNLATLKNWPLKITIIDLIWGTTLSTVVSTITYYVYTLFK